MKLVRIGPPGAERPGVMVGTDSWIDLTDDVGDFNESFFDSGAIADLGGLIAARVAAGGASPIGDQRIGSPIARPHQIVCIGLNYRDHAIETGQAIPDEPIVFTKAPNTLVGPYDDVSIPPNSQKSDWEVELGLVIGRRASYLPSPEAAADHIAGYVLVNDVSEREYQLERGGQWSKGKSCPTFNPCGPWLVTADELPGVNQLDLWLRVNGETLQSSNTSEMIFDSAYIVWYLSQFMTLEPGDLINTGTPHGVGMGFNPQRFLTGGDEMHLGIAGLGEQRQLTKQFETAR